MMIAPFCKSLLGRLLVGAKRLHALMLISASCDDSWYHSTVHKELLDRKVSLGHLADIPWSTELTLVLYGADVN